MATRGRTGFKRRVHSIRGPVRPGRAILAVIAIVLCFFSVRASLAMAVAKVDPARAFSLAPGNGEIAARYAQQLFSRELTADSRSAAAATASRALLQDATAADALNVLAFQAQLRGDAAKAAKIFRYSNMLSQRELQPRIWAIEATVTQGDIVGALRHYDIALRTSREAGVVLYPSLGAALDEPKIRAALLPILASRPPWQKSFFDYIASNRIAPEGHAALLVEGRARGIKASDEVQARIIDALLELGRPKNAWELYHILRGPTSLTSSRDPTLSAAISSRTAFDWRTGDDTRLGVAILANGREGVIDFAVPPQIGGILVRQTQLLPPGTYRLEGRFRLSAPGEALQSYWTLVCPDNLELGRLWLTEPGIEEGRFAGEFTVPQGCEVQVLQLVALPTGTSDGVGGQILEARLRPAR